ncbi:scavenger receptor class B member 1-like [Centruroides sculpturatus]|uniref:scavenger receptor class B member 1-like n=1 Tax=Centruroides sculpturatus TaxID=218467 RepID=UPI000C6EEDD0|nr:scavenger receptor class B member 1-like [Centruroides sculpturatus]
MTLSPVAKTGVLVTFGALFALAGLLLYVLFPNILKWQVEKRLILSEESEMYEQWKEPSLPIYLEIYLFNITNPEDVEANISKPIVEEVGPFSFRTAAVGAHKMNNTVINTFMSEFFHHINSTVFISKTPRELLFDGYNDTILAVMKEMFPQLVPFTKFGWFYKKNESDGNFTFNIFTGEKGIQNYGSVDNWNGDSNVTIWQTPCNQIDGSMGEMWPPFRKSRYEKLDLFIPDICRKISLNYLSDVELEGIEAYRYIMDHTTFDNGKYDPTNRCYCINDCLPAGGLDVSMCQKGAPIVMSAPHFLYGDVAYTQSVMGLKPDPQRHLFHIDLQPQMGVPVNVGAKMQINVIIEKIEGIMQFANITGRTYFPALWFTQSFTINEPLIKKLQMVTQDIPYYVNVGSFLSICVGVVALLCAIAFSCQVLRKKKEKKGVYKAIRVVKS